MQLDAQTIAGVLTAVIPALGPYGPAVALSLAVAEKAAPVIYEEIVSLLKQIHEGNTISDADIAKLQEMISRLKNPDVYFE